MFINQLLNPPKGILFGTSLISFCALIFVFVSKRTESVLAYLIYGMSAYSLVCLCVQAPEIIRNLILGVHKSRIVKKLNSIRIVNKYFSDVIFRGTLSIYQGVIWNFLYMAFRFWIGIMYASMWSISMAVYYLLLGLIRSYLIFYYRHGDSKKEIMCYRNIAWFLFLLNIPMGGMILLMIRTNSGFSYPGYVIYLSALYMFYTLIVSIVNIFKYRKIGSPILSAGKVLNFVSALMSILGLQTAMISRFSTHGDDYRKMMNTIMGGCVYTGVIIIALYMLVHSYKILREGKVV